MPQLFQRIAASLLLVGVLALASCGGDDSRAEVTPVEGDDDPPTLSERTATSNPQVEDTATATRSIDDDGTEDDDGTPDTEDDGDLETPTEEVPTPTEPEEPTDEPVTGGGSVANPWVDGSGMFYVEQFDQRAFSEEEKAAFPVYDPRWEGFAGCMAATGYGVPTSTGVVSQQDLNALVAQVNAENPDTLSNALGQNLSPLAVAFSDCANENLGRALTDDDNAQISAQAYEQAGNVWRARAAAGVPIPPGVAAEYGIEVE